VRSLRMADFDQRKRRPPCRPNDLRRAIRSGSAICRENVRPRYLCRERSTCRCLPAAALCLIHSEHGTSTPNARGVPMDVGHLGLAQSATHRRRSISGPRTVTLTRAIHAAKP
jgi:hypothetical protein